MIPDVIKVEYVKDTELALTFSDDKSGTVDIARLIEFTGIFEPLKDPAYFQQVTINPELGTIVWPNHADIDPVVLYEACK